MINYQSITENDIQKKLATMPADLRVVFGSDEFGTAIELLAEDHKIREDEVAILQALVGIYLLNLISGEELAMEISDKLLLDPIESEEMAAEIAAITMEARMLLPKTTPNPPSLDTQHLSIPKPVFKEPPVSKSPEPAKIKIEFYGGAEKPTAASTPSTPTYNEPKTKSVAISPDIHPENVIDLKDLPQ